MDETAPEAISELTTECADLLRHRGYRLAVAESCTGGWLAKTLTDLPGSSEWFDRGFVTYSNQAKQAMLGVTNETLQQYGAVSKETVNEMTQGTLHVSGVEVAVSISGIAGPGGGSVEKPVGTVCFGWQIRGEEMIVTEEWFDGDRQHVRWQAVVHALKQLVQLLGNG